MNHKLQRCNEERARVFSFMRDMMTFRPRTGRLATYWTAELPTKAGRSAPAVIKKRSTK